MSLDTSHFGKETGTVASINKANTDDKGSLRIGAKESVKG